MSTYKVEEFENVEATDLQLRDMNELNNVLNKEFLPNDPPTLAGEFIAEVRSQTNEARIRHRIRLMRGDDGKVIGFSALRTEEFPENRHIARLNVGVHPQHRRRGLALRLLAPFVETAAQEGRELIAGYAVEGSVGEDFAKRLGAEMQLRQVLNRVNLDQVDRDMLKGWIERASDRASEYSIEFWEGPTSDENLEAFTRVTNSMNDAPRPEAVNDWTPDPERIRNMEKGGIDAGFSLWTMVARHGPTGDIGGHTQIWLSPWKPEFVYQGNTGVLAEHRNRGLGRWLKAAMLEKVFEELPEAKIVETGNAATNEAMLSINHEIGFGPALVWGNYLVPVEKLSAALAERGLG